MTHGRRARARARATRERERDKDKVRERREKGAPVFFPRGRHVAFATGNEIPCTLPDYYVKEKMYG